MRRTGTTNKIHVVSTFVVALVCLHVVHLIAGDRINVRGMGMARTSVVNSRGLDAIGINPANLAFPEELMSLTILPAGAFLSSDFFSYELYSKYFQNRAVLADLPVGDKEFILSSFENINGTIRMQADLRLFGITLRPSPHSTIAFTVDYGLLGAATIPREYARLLLYGNVPGSTFEVDGLTINAYWARAYTLSYGQQLPAPDFLSWLSGGVSIKLIQGYGFYGVERFRALANVESDGVITAVLSWKARRTNANTFSQPMENLFQNPAGYGVGIDAGLSGGLGEHVSFGISVTDIGRIKWTEDVEEFTFDSTVSSTKPDIFKRAHALADSATGGHRSTNPFSTPLPATIRFGLCALITQEGDSDLLPGELTVATEYLQGIVQGSPVAEHRRISFAAEYKPVQWLPLRTGVAFTERAPRIAFGFGFDFRRFKLDIGTEDILWFFNRSILTGSVGMAMRFRIPD